jgi:heme-degrading monooxygenase HmoA
MKKTGQIKIVWEYIVKPEHLEGFLKAYSPDGSWATLFMEHRGYIATELIRDTSHSMRFLTIDHWESLSAYSEMKNRSRKAYRELDEKFEKYTVDENYIGIFEGV